MSVCSHLVAQLHNLRTMLCTANAVSKNMQICTPRVQWILLVVNSPPGIFNWNISYSEWKKKCKRVINSLLKSNCNLFYSLTDQLLWSQTKSIASLQLWEKVTAAVTLLDVANWRLRMTWPKQSGTRSPCPKDLVLPDQTTWEENFSHHILLPLVFKLKTKTKLRSFREN